MTDAAAAVILDLDGVLVDSEPTHLRAWDIAASRLGDALPEDFYAATRGLRTRDTAEWLARRLGQPVDVLRRYRDQAKATMAGEIAPFPEVPLALARLCAAGVPIAVGSSGTSTHVRACLTQLALRDVPTVTGDDVARGKPAPDIFLRCADGLGVDPGQIVVVEDAPNGVRAARAAGMTTIGVQRVPTPPLQADVVVDDMLAAAEWILAAFTSPGGGR